jgi:hypothetical protein
MGKNVRDDRTTRKQARMKAMLHLAAEDAKAAKLLAQGGNHYAAYHCQQASEKLVRTLLIHHDIEPGLDHHLDVLVAKLPESESWRATGPRHQLLERLPDDAIGAAGPQLDQGLEDGLQVVFRHAAQDLGCVQLDEAAQARRRSSQVNVRDVDRVDRRLEPRAAGRCRARRLCGDVANQPLGRAIGERVGARVRAEIDVEPALVRCLLVHDLAVDQGALAPHDGRELLGRQAERSGERRERGWMDDGARQLDAVQRIRVRADGCQVGCGEELFDGHGYTLYRVRSRAPSPGGPQVAVPSRYRQAPHERSRPRRHARPREPPAVAASTTTTSGCPD